MFFRLLAVAFFVLPCTMPWTVMSAERATAAQAPQTLAERDAAGLWAYKNISLGREGAPPARLSGLFLFKDGWFVQQSLNDGEPFDQQVLQAHAGPYRVEGDKIHLTANVGFIVNPTAENSVQSRRDSQHVVTPIKVGEQLELRFGSGTIQRFHRAGPGRGEVYPLERGALALVDGYFILVAESAGGAVAGSGRFERKGPILRLDAARWATVTSGKATYARGAMEARFDGRSLETPGGTVFTVIKPTPTR